MFITVLGYSGIVQSGYSLTATGNGIQEAFYDNPNVLYISLHVHENGQFYPSGNYGDHLHCGEDAGVGK